MLGSKTERIIVMKELVIVPSLAQIQVLKSIFNSLCMSEQRDTCVHDAVFDVGDVKTSVTLGCFSNLLIMFNEERKIFACYFLTLESMKVAKDGMLVDFY